MGGGGGAGGQFLIGLQLLPLVQVVKAGGSGGAITKSGNQAMYNICMILSSGECDICLGLFKWYGLYEQLNHLHGRLVHQLVQFYYRLG